MVCLLAEMPCVTPLRSSTAAAMPVTLPRMDVTDWPIAASASTTRLVMAEERKGRLIGRQDGHVGCKLKRSLGVVQGCQRGAGLLIGGKGYHVVILQ